MKDRLVQTGEFLVFTEVVTISQISVCEYALDSAYTGQLISAIEQGEPVPKVVLRPRFAQDSQITYDVADGFHTIAAITALGYESTEAVIHPGMNDEELCDRRVVSDPEAGKGKLFNRLYWMRESFYTHPWSEDVNRILDQNKLTLTQALRVIYTNSNGKTFGLSPQGKEEIAEWIFSKVKKWGKELTGILNEYQVVDHSDPALVAQINVKEPYNLNALNFSRLAIISRAAPDDYELQNQLANAINGKKIPARNIPLFCWRVVQAKKFGDLKTLQELFENPNGILDQRDNGVTRSDTYKRLIKSLEIIIDTQAGIINRQAQSDSLVDILRRENREMVQEIQQLIEENDELRMQNKQLSERINDEDSSYVIYSNCEKTYIFDFDGACITDGQTTWSFRGRNNFELLKVLIENPLRSNSKEHIFRRVWRDGVNGFKAEYIWVAVFRLKEDLNRIDPQLGDLIVKISGGYAWNWKATKIDDD